MSVSGLRIGHATFRDIAGVKGHIDADNPLACVSADGHVGSNLMREAVWQIDYAAETATVTPSVEGLDHIDGAIALDFFVATPSSPSPLVRSRPGMGSWRF